MNKILIVTEHYIPGFKDGGPIISFMNMVENLGEIFQFSFIVFDRDQGDDKPYDNISIGKWNTVEKAQVFYSKTLYCRDILKAAKDKDMIIIGGCFIPCSIRVLLMKRMGILKIPVLIAAHGYFSPKEFKNKYWKKGPFMKLTRVLGLYKDVSWMASTSDEEDDIRRVLHEVKHCYVARNLPKKVDYHPVTKHKGNRLKVIFLSRIVWKKNLRMAIDILKKVGAPIDFSIAGHIEDEKYWEKCLEELANLPDNITWKYLGQIPTKDVLSTFEEQHVFLFPTWGENYGHVIMEALTGGCPVLLSKETPWHDVEEQGVGYEIEFEQVDKFRDVLESYAAMSQEEFQKISDKAVAYAKEKSLNKAQIHAFINMFQAIIDGK